MKKSLISKSFIVLDPNKNATQVENTPSVFQDLDTTFNNFINHELISAFDFSEDWTSWEMHPNGDEIVMLLSGKVTFILQIDDKNKEVQLDTLGDYVIIPKGTWHTAQTNIKSQILFITPGEGTQHKNN